MASNNMMGKLTTWRAGSLGFRTGVITLICILLNIIALYFIRRLFLDRWGGSHPRRPHRDRTSRAGGSKRKNRRHDGEGAIKKSLPCLLLLLGIPGSGKTTWVNQYVETCDRSFVIVNEDSVQGAVTAEKNDSSWEAEVRGAIISGIVQQLKEKQNVVLDDSLRVMDEKFRHDIITAAPACNLLVKQFPIKAFYAYTRLLKDAEEGNGGSYLTEIELEELEMSFDKAWASMKLEGWNPLLDTSYSRSKHN
ncbi:retrotransposon hot spot (RHS) protein [Trypanosoma rangeli]|uniref:Retrotransposon hot spot (RHS) protein n=1 Tax=Trypanosoma rangeli TaxID=5698 RepID=A0A3R7RME9_TRYRA|nr:retrotransposon hot spot (RHS) protein [Trypanosoma rangeli]RNF07053.1 retrotransposon hot spot (RHS) protein [Trypanosoma rangeli]|eukprot:RNF07053.1 retrotransposon hot spot (RHS) protein [Trypanosoma rangeli]